MSTSDIIGLCINGLMALGVCGGTVIALLAFLTWHRELRGPAEYELARRLLLRVYKVRWAIHAFRRELDFEEAALETKWNRINEPARELDADILEAKVLWPGALDTPRKTLKKCIDHIFLNIRKRDRQQKKQNVQENERAAVDAVLWGDESDDFGSRVEDAVRQFEKALEPFLMRKKTR